MTMSKVDIIWDDSAITIIGSSAVIESELCYTHKAMITERYKRKVKYEKVKLYVEIPPVDNRRTIVTYQGLLDEILSLCVLNNLPFNFHDKRLPFISPRADKMFGFRGTQEQLLKDFLLKDRSGLCVAPTRYGKCLSPDTEVLMFNGTKKKVKDITVGEKVMGPDSLPRTVKHLISGSDEMFKIIPTKGDSWECNKDHVLSLQCTDSKSFPKGQIRNITVEEYLTKSKSFKQLFKQYHVVIEYPAQKVEYDPYCLGVWIGAGTVNKSEVTKYDKEIHGALNTYLTPFELTQKSKDTKAYANNKWTKTSTKHLTQLAKHCYFNNEKRIPKEYLINSKEIRLSVLAGLIDTDGYNNQDKGFEITTKYKGLAEDIVYLARSSGLRVSCVEKIDEIKSINFKGLYYRILIFGAVDTIPTKIPRKQIKKVVGRVNSLLTGFKIESLGIGEYCGFEIEEDDKRFVLGNFAVTHNSVLILNTLRAYPTTQTIVTAPGVDLLNQMYAELTVGLPNREINCIYSGKKNKGQSEDITLVSLDSLHHCDVHGTKLILCDEPHAAVTQTRMPVLNNFKYARKFGYGATPEGRFDGCDILIKAIFGPPLVEKSFKEAVDEGAILMIKVLMVKIHFEPFVCKDRDAAYRKLIFNNDGFNELVEKISNRIIPKDWQTLIFINNEKQADKLNKLLDCSVGMAKKLNKVQREELFAAVTSEKIKRCICSDIYSTGVTFPDLRCVVNCNSGAGGILSTQKPGRLAQIRVDKAFGYMIDFQFIPLGDVSLTTHPKRENEWWSVVNDCKARMGVYKEKEYLIEEVDDLSQIKLI